MLNAGPSPEHEEKLGSEDRRLACIPPKFFMLQAVFLRKKNRLRSIRACCKCFNDKPVTLRTLDDGADKQLPYMPISEENPCLGWRGIRITVNEPEIFSDPGSRHAACQRRLPATSTFAADGNQH
ncbi:putative PEP-binding protein [Shigella flexneri]